MKRDDMVAVPRAWLLDLREEIGPTRFDARARLCEAGDDPAVDRAVFCMDGCGAVIPGTGGVHRRADEAGWARNYDRRTGRSRFRCPSCSSGV